MAMSLWDWASEKISTIGSKIKQAYDYVSVTVQAVVIAVTESNFIINFQHYFRFLTSLPAIRNAAHSAAVQFWEGGTRPLDPHNVTRLMNSPRSRGVLYQSFNANIIHYLIQAICLEWLRATIVDGYSDENDSYLESSFHSTVSIIVYTSMILMLVHRLFENAIINSSMNKFVIEENPSAAQYHIPTQQTGIVTSTTAGLFTNVNTLSRMITINLLMKKIPYITPVIKAYVYGESVVEVPFNVVGASTEQRAAELAKHKMYSLGMGASLFLTIEGLSFLVSHYVGVEGFFINDALFNFIYPYFVGSILLRDRPMPGTEPGIDLLHYHRKITRRMARDLSAWAITHIKNPPQMLHGAINRADMGNRVREVMARPSMLSVRQILTFDRYTNWRSLEQYFLTPPAERNLQMLEGFVTSPALILFLNAYYRDIMIALKMKIIIDSPLAQRLREGGLVEIFAPIVPSIPRFFTGFIAAPIVLDGIQLVTSQTLSEPAKQVAEFLKMIRAMQLRHLEKGFDLSDIELELDMLINASHMDVPPSLKPRIEEPSLPLRLLNGQVNVITDYLSAPPKQSEAGETASLPQIQELPEEPLTELSPPTPPPPPTPPQPVMQETQMSPESTPVAPMPVAEAEGMHTPMNEPKPIQSASGSSTPTMQRQFSQAAKPPPPRRHASGAQLTSRSQPFHSGHRLFPTHSLSNVAEALERNPTQWSLAKPRPSQAPDVASVSLPPQDSYDPERLNYYQYNNGC